MRGIQSVRSASTGFGTRVMRKHDVVFGGAVAVAGVTCITCGDRVVLTGCASVHACFRLRHVGGELVAVLWFLAVVPLGMASA